MKRFHSIAQILLAASIILMLSMRPYSGTTYYYGTHSGNITITQTSTSPALADGDRIVITGTFGELSVHDLIANSLDITVDVSGATFTSPTTFHQPEWYSLQHVRIVGMQSIDWNGTIKLTHLINHLTFDSSVFKNPLGNYKSQPVMQWDDAANAYSMQFSSTIDQTFYSNSILHSKFEGFQDATVIIIGSLWSNSNENKRGIFLDGLFDTDTLWKITNTTSAFNVVSGTGWNMTVRNCRVDSISANAGAYQHNHTADFLWYGSINAYNNFASTQYASFLRNVPSGWTGLPGYIGNGTASRAWSNIDTAQLSYSPFEFGQNGLGGRTTTNGVYPCKWFCVYNTVYKTVGDSYNGPPYRYYGRVVDVVNCDSGTIEGNCIINPEMDYTFDSTTYNYIWAQVSAAPSQQVVRNNFVGRPWSNAYTNNLVSFIPTPGGPLIGKGTAYSFRTTDYKGNILPASNQDIGANQYIPPIPGPKKIIFHRRVVGNH